MNHDWNQSSSDIDTDEPKTALLKREQLLKNHHLDEMAHEAPRITEVILGEDDPEDKTLHETIVSENTMWRGRIFSANRLDVVLPDGRTSTRDIVRHGGAVAIVAVTSDNKICLVRQYRTAFDRVMVEIPAGKLEPGEDPLSCAQRELLEETGFEAGNMAYLTTIASSCGFTDEIIHIYLACDLKYTQPNPDDGEFLNVDLVDADELIAEVLDGRIEDAKTVIGALIWDAVSRRLTR